MSGVREGAAVYEFGVFVPVCTDCRTLRISKAYFFALFAATFLPAAFTACILYLFIDCCVELQARIVASVPFYMDFQLPRAYGGRTVLYGMVPLLDETPILRADGRRVFCAASRRLNRTFRMRDFAVASVFVAARRIALAVDSFYMRAQTF